MEPAGSFKEQSFVRASSDLLCSMFKILQTIDNSVSLKLIHWTPFDKFFGTFRDKLKETGTTYQGGSEEKVDAKVKFIPMS